MDYTPHTEEEIQAMLEKVGVEVLNPPIHLPDPMPEWAVLEELSRLAGENLPARKAFLGGGEVDGGV